MNSRTLAVILAVLAAVFIVLNFTVEGAGTILLILAVASGLAAAFLFSRKA